MTHTNNSERKLGIIDLETGEVTAQLNKGDSVTDEGKVVRKESKEAFANKRKQYTEGAKSDNPFVFNDVGNIVALNASGKIANNSLSALGLAFGMSSFITFTHGNRTPFKTLPSIAEALKISLSAVKRHVVMATDLELISRDEEGYFHVSERYFRMGKVEKDKFYVKAYKKGVRSLFDIEGQHTLKTLGVFFLILPYVGTETNFLVENPEETDLSLLKPLSIRNLSKLVRISHNTLREMLSTFNILYEWRGDNFRIGCFALIHNYYERRNAIRVNPMLVGRGDEEFIKDFLVGARIVKG